MNNESGRTRECIGTMNLTSICCQLPPCEPDNSLLFLLSLSRKRERERLDVIVDT